MKYDIFGNLTGITANGVRILTNTFDNRKRLVTSQNAQGLASSRTRHYTYDVFDRVTEIRYTNPAGTQLHLTTIAYSDIRNAQGDSRITTTIHGDTNAPNIATFVQYDRFGRRTQEGVTGGQIFTFTHDLAGRVITETSLGVNNTFTHNIFGVTSVRNIGGNTSRNHFDAMGRLVRSSDFMSNYTHFYYDALGRLIQRRVPFERIGNTTHYAVNRYFFDRGGNLIRTAVQTNVPGQAATWAETVNTFTHNRLMTARIGGTGTGGITTTYIYNLAGNILTQRVGSATTTFDYDTRGRLTRTTDAMGQSETFGYDANSNLLTKTDRNGIVFWNTFDGLGRLVQQDAGGIRRTYTFTATGAIRTASNGNHTITKRYDAQGRLIRQEETGGIIKTFAYNAANNRTRSRIYVNNQRHIYNTYTYTAAQQFHTMRANGVLQVTETYNDNGLLTRSALGNGVRTDYTRNLAGLPTVVSNMNGNTVLSRFTYTHHLDGNVQQRVELMNGATRTITYTYDTARRLTREESTVGGGVGAFARQYTFDNRGNRTRMTVTGTEVYTVNYTYDLNNRLLTEVRTGAGAVSRTFTYDRNGNTLTQTPGKVTGGAGRYLERLSYNALNQKTGFSITGGWQVWNITYRADGLRHLMSPGNVSTTYVWNGSQIIMHLNSSGGVTNRFYRIPNGRLIRGTRHGWYLYNARGDVIQRTNDSRAVLHTYRYTAFGVEVGVQRSDNAFRFGGEHWCLNSGLYYLRNRMFEPRTGRFTQPDPFWGVHNMQDSPLAMLQSANLYLYGVHNPVKWNDPDGLFVVPAIITGVVAIATTAATSTRARTRGRSPSRNRGTVNTFNEGLRLGVIGHFADIGRLMNPRTAASAVTDIIGNAIDNPIATIDSMLMQFRPPHSRALLHRANMNMLLQTQGEFAAGMYAGRMLGQSATQLISLAAGGAGKKLSGAASATQVPLTRTALHKDLAGRGFVRRPPSQGGYVVYRHSSGARVTIKPSGEVIPTRRVRVNPGDTSPTPQMRNMRVFYDGSPVPGGRHSTGHFVEPWWSWRR